jgi:methanethiol oxidase
MPMLTPDPTFYPSPRMATQAPPETYPYLALINSSGTSSSSTTSPTRSIRRE